MSSQYPALIVAVPLLSALFISIAGWVNKRFCFPIVVAALGVTAYSSIGLLFRVLNEGVIVYKLGGWDPPMGIAYYVDHLNGLVFIDRLESGQRESKLKEYDELRAAAAAEGR